MAPNRPAPYLGSDVFSAENLTGVVSLAGEVDAAGAGFSIFGLAGPNKLLFVDVAGGAPKRLFPAAAFPAPNSPPGAAGGAAVLSAEGDLDDGDVFKF